jgi:hypothetical protein
VLLDLDHYQTSDMAFSGALQLTDLDDFLAPSQACILPVKQKNKVTDQANGVNPDVSSSPRVIVF